MYLIRTGQEPAQPLGISDHWGEGRRRSPEAGGGSSARQQSTARKETPPCLCFCLETP